MISKLLSTPTNKRDEAWTQEFLKALIGTTVKMLSPDPRQGPEGFPYMMVSTDEGKEPFLNVVKWCSEKGIGIVLNPQKPHPDFLFTYGNLWNYISRGEFFSASPSKVDSKSFQLKDGQALFAGKPTEAFWPVYARGIFKEFLLQQGFMNVRFLLLSEKAEGPMDMVFSLESLGNPPETEWPGILEGFSWFFPSHYPLALLSEKSISGMEFQSI